jgi:hypothetical protein
MPRSMISSISRQAGRTKGCPTNNNTGGSMSFAGTTSSYLTVPNSADFRFGTGDFTIEWYMYSTGAVQYPRIFSMGTLSNSTTSIAVSIEGGSFYFWINRGAYLFGGLGGVSVTNVWTHFAITRSGTSIRVFRNGTQLGSTLISSNDFNDTTNILTFGNEGIRAANTAYQGLITNFHVVKGTALYTAKFCVPQTPRARVSNTVLLLNAVTSGTVTVDSNDPPKTVTNVGVTFSSSKPT